jgi:histidinol-phosphate/aromatic aminotransferase/cobyric acid decarboxylase-like protein
MELSPFLFSDEVYRELEHDPAKRLPPACDEYELAVSLGGISKSYGLPGLRLGSSGTRARARLVLITDWRHDDRSRAGTPRRGPGAAQHGACL